MAITENRATPLEFGTRLALLPAGRAQAASIIEHFGECRRSGFTTFAMVAAAFAWATV